MIPDKPLNKNELESYCEHRRKGDKKSCDIPECKSTSDKVRFRGDTCFICYQVRKGWKND